MKIESQVSQFTLLASTKKGNKPDFHGAAGGEKAKELYDCFFTKIQELYDTSKVKNGVFQAMMEVNLQNSGPVTLEIETTPPKISGEQARTSEMKDKVDNPDLLSGLVE
ncbi:D-tyrosyl-tRNA(Tyr) deacylase [Bacidia gigantensis]|uniref:D-tyrosyl-tRNA(Tyr) deacylase n=1 Tax=Bacidia gigantensis TaxID=2732470 RepID=UPI001D04F956|nr:D-tyrosyl-tRNA(Tyr) deacylase [Bacidia gigantensis]KAG8529433.1 D-tyrosyl-tRNA(Tyr) deacylase [Bacidia gigantensis]